MVDVQVLLDQLLRWAYFIAQYWDCPWLQQTTIIAAGAIVLGTLLCLYGGKLLRTVYMLIFLAAGGAVGVRVARGLDVDVLIGLVVGAGLSALIGYLLFRWWVGLTVSFVAVAAVSLTTASWLMEDARQFADALLEQTVGKRAFSVDWDSSGVLTAPQGPEVPADETARLSPWQVLSGFKASVLERRPAECRRLAIYAAIAAILGLSIGLFVPRLVIILGTTLVGGGLLALGAGSVLLRYFPGAWDWAQAHHSVVVGCFLAILALSILHQARMMSLPKVLPPPPAPPRPKTA